MSDTAMPNKCQKRISVPPWHFHSHQCSRDVWKDGWCKQHHPDNVKARYEKGLRERLEMQNNDPIHRAQQRIAELERELAEAVAKERERCVKAVEETKLPHWNTEMSAQTCVDYAKRNIIARIRQEAGEGERETVSRNALRKTREAGNDPN